jgi:hypothetical protein
MKAIKNTNNFFTQFGVKEHRKLDYTKIHHKGLQELEFPNSTIYTNIRKLLSLEMIKIPILQMLPCVQNKDK